MRGSPPLTCKQQQCPPATYNQPFPYLHIPMQPPCHLRQLSCTILLPLTILYIFIINISLKKMKRKRKQKHVSWYCDIVMVEEVCGVVVCDVTCGDMVM